MKILHRSVMTTIFITALTFNLNVNAAPVAITNSSNILMGINGVEISGYGTWDVSFNIAWDGQAHTKDFAEKASTAIHDIFSPGGFLSGGIYDTNTRLTNGCTATGNQCDMVTVFNDNNAYREILPYVGGKFWRNFPHNYASTESPETATVYMGGAFGLISNSSATHLSWDNSQYTVSAVPVPASLLLFMPALIGLLGLRRKLNS